MVKRRVTIVLDESLVRAIDEVRGPIPRNTFIELLETNLSNLY